MTKINLIARIKNFPVFKYLYYFISVSISICVIFFVGFAGLISDADNWFRDCKSFSATDLRICDKIENNYNFLKKATFFIIINTYKVLEFTVIFLGENFIIIAINAIIILFLFVIAVGNPIKRQEKQFNQNLRHGKSHDKLALDKHPKPRSQPPRQTGSARSQGKRKK